MRIKRQNSNDHGRKLKYLFSCNFAHYPLVIRVQCTALRKFSFSADTIPILGFTQMYSKMV